jgi:LytS/YehU family sensor histidine kinase
LITAVVVRRWHLVGATALEALPFVPFLRVWFPATFSMNILSVAMIIGVAHASLYAADLNRRRRRNAELEARLATAELNMLRMQLQPHFFFNALHTISALMITDVSTAQEVVASLGEIVRASIDHTARQEVALREELDFLKQYVAIQRARFRGRLEVQMTVPDGVLDAAVPSLVLQPLVENAIRHGIERRTHGGIVSIDAVARDGQLQLRVHDAPFEGDGEGSPVTPNGSRSIGIGLANIEARLRQLYGPRQRFTAQKLPGGGFDVSLMIPLHYVVPSSVT